MLCEIPALAWLLSVPYHMRKMRQRSREMWWKRLRGESEGRMFLDSGSRTPAPQWDVLPLMMAHKDRGTAENVYAYEWRDYSHAQFLSRANRVREFARGSLVQRTSELGSEN